MEHILGACSLTTEQPAKGLEPEEPHLEPPAPPCPAAQAQGFQRENDGSGPRGRPLALITPRHRFSVHLFWSKVATGCLVPPAGDHGEQGSGDQNWLSWRSLPR